MRSRIAAGLNNSPQGTTKWGIEMQPVKKRLNKILRTKITKRCGMSTLTVIDKSKEKQIATLVAGGENSRCAAKRAFSQKRMACHPFFVRGGRLCSPDKASEAGAALLDTQRRGCAAITESSIGRFVMQRNGSSRGHIAKDRFFTRALTYSTIFKSNRSGGDT